MVPDAKVAPSSLLMWGAVFTARMEKRQTRGTESSS
jgi:hypothetical protein